MNFGTNGNDVLRRAELFDFIADLVRSWPFADELPDNLSLPRPTPCPPPSPPPLPPTVKLAAASLLPHIAVLDQQLACNTSLLDLKRRPLMLRLFRIFCEAEDRRLTREDILRHVYQIKDFDQRSERYLESKYANAVKLISRARILATTHLGRSVRHGVEWFVYDKDLQLWCLFRMRNEYFARLFSQ